VADGLLDRAEAAAAWAERLRHERVLFLVTARDLRADMVVTPRRERVRDLWAEAQSLNERVSALELVVSGNASVGVGAVLDVAPVVLRGARLQMLYSQIEDRHSNALARSLAYRQFAAIPHSELEMTDSFVQRWVEDVFLATGSDEVAYNLSASMLRMTLTAEMKDAGMRLLSHRHEAVRKVALEALEKYGAHGGAWGEAFLAECSRMSREDASNAVREKARYIEEQYR
jgi:hypothetical protein